MKPCPYCQDGYVNIEEDGRPISHPCYHCGNEGVISDEEHARDRLIEAVNMLAVRSLGAINRNELAESAGEYGLTTHQLFDDMVYLRSQRFASLVDLIEQQDDGMLFLQAIADQLVPEVQEVMAAPEPQPVYQDNSDDIPF